MTSNQPRRRRNDDEQQPAPKKGSLNNMEMLGISFFCLALLLWGISKCGAEPVVEEQPIVTEEVVDSTINNTPTPPVVAALPARRVDTSSFKNKLYIITDSLRFRKEPKLGGEVVGYLSYGEEVEDMGERSALEKIRLSVDEIRTAPWVKLRTKGGKEGWAFGAYMQFYPVATETNTPDVTEHNVQ